MKIRDQLLALKANKRIVYLAVQGYGNKGSISGRLKEDGFVFWVTTPVGDSWPFSCSHVTHIDGDDILLASWAINNERGRMALDAE